MARNAEKRRAGEKKCKCESEFELIEKLQFKQ